MKKMAITALSLAAALAFAGCTPGHSTTGASATAAAETQAAAIRDISPEEAKELIGKADVVLLDVRTQSEYDEGHIEGAVLLPYSAIAADSAGLPADKDTALIVYCRSGQRSAAAAKTLSGLGYTRIYDLGGLQSWPYETVQ